MDVLKAVLLGLVEGVTEFLPVSSTGHLLLLEHFFGFDDEAFGKTFVVLIQLGAILAILSLYFGRLWGVLLALPRDPDARRFALGVLIAFLPAALIGATFSGFIKGVLFNPAIVCCALIVGGLVLLVVDQTRFETRFEDAMRFPLSMYLKIGAVQCLAMVPGVSRSGATIVGAMMLGADKRAAAEFSFFLAIPTMSGAFAYDLYKSRAMMSLDNALVVGVGFLAAFLAGLVVVRFLLAYVSRRGFSLFAWWRLAVGSLGLAGLLVFG